MSRLSRLTGEVLERGLDRLQLRRAPHRPEQIHLSVTDRCFLPCLHCDIWKNEATDLPGTIWLDLIDRLGDWCAPAGMNFVGGEPLLRRDLEQLIGQAVRRGFTTSFNTNGWLVNAQRAKAISEAGASIAYVSLDGMRAETIDHSRGKVGSFDKAMEAMGVPKQKWDGTRERFMKVLLDEHETILSSYLAQKYGGGEESTGKVTQG